jgi:hypothetical protein
MCLFTSNILGKTFSSTIFSIGIVYRLLSFRLFLQKYSKHWMLSNFEHICFHIKHVYVKSFFKFLENLE